MRGAIYGLPIGLPVGALLAYDKISPVSAVLLIIVLGAGAGFLSDRAIGAGRGRRSLGD